MSSFVQCRGACVGHWPPFLALVEIKRKKSGWGGKKGRIYEFYG